MTKCGLGVLLLVGAQLCPALTPGEVLVVGNGRSPVSKAIVEYYARRRAIPPEQILMLATAPAEEIDRRVYERQIAAPVVAFLVKHGLADRVLAIVTTTGVPLKIRGTDGIEGTQAAVDSELAMLYWKAARKAPLNPPAGPLPNPYFGHDEPFSHPRFPMYLVTRLTGYSFEDVRAMIDRSLVARNVGRVVLDQQSATFEQAGDAWLNRTATLIGGRAKLDQSKAVVPRGERDLIGAAGWGSNDKARSERDLGFVYLPGAIVTEFVSTNARSFAEPPGNWKLGTWADEKTFFAGTPQSMSGDAIRQGASAVTGHVYEPYLKFCPRPDYLFPAYLNGRSLAESFYTAIPALSWVNVVVGDPLMRLAPP